MYKKITILFIGTIFSFLSSCPRQDNSQNVIIGQPNPNVNDSPSDIKRAVSISTFPPENQLVFEYYDTDLDYGKIYRLKILPIVKYNDGSTDSDVHWNIGASH